MSFCAGVDPGKRGALAIIEDRQVLSVIDCPLTKVPGRKALQLDTPRLASIIRRVVRDHPGLFVTIEQVGTFKHDGKVGAFGFGGNFYAWQAAFLTAGARVLLVEPKHWKKVIIGSGRGSDKGASVKICHLLFENSTLRVPDAKRHDRAEAILLAEYGQRYLAREAISKAGKLPA